MRDLSIYCKEQLYHRERIVEKKTDDPPAKIDGELTTSFQEEYCSQNECLSTKRKAKLKCDICPYATTRKSSFEKHLTFHSGEKLFKCNICSFSGAYKSSLIRHLRIHGEKTFQVWYLLICSTCKQ